jgi:DNA-binding MarR family transcriptional regulator
MTLNVDDLEWTNKLIRVIEEFRKLNQDITANQILTFLLIAQRENVTQKELEKGTGLNSGTISRICAIMSDRGLKARNAEPMNLIRIGNAPDDYRVSAQSLAPNGKRVLNGLRAIMKGR